MSNINEAKKEDKKEAQPFIQLVTSVIKDTGSSTTLVFQFNEPKYFNMFRAEIAGNKLTCQLNPIEIKGQDQLYGMEYCVRIKCYAKIQADIVRAIAAKCNALEYKGTNPLERPASMVKLSEV